jgi:hypothetical protein
MRISILVLVLVFLDGALYWGLRRLGRERAELESRREQLSLRAATSRESGERSQKIEALLRRGSQAIEPIDRALDIAELRDLLLEAERGLDLDRFSLDFRPAQDAPKGREGGRIAANLGGSFDAVHDYLGRVEDLRLPLALQAVSLGADDSGRILLAIEWNGLWGRETKTLEDSSSSDIARIESWLAQEPAPLPSRDLFADRKLSAVSLPAPLSRESPAPVTPAAAPSDQPSAAAPPRLTGFVIARPEVETDVDRRVLAAVRFEGELRLLGVGDAIGSYRVEAIEPRDSVVLINQESGERLKLFLE